MAGTWHGLASFAVAASRPSHEMPAKADARRKRIPQRIRRPGTFKGPRTRAILSRGQWDEQRSALLAGRVHVRFVWRKFQLARADMDAGQFSDHRIASEIPPLLRRRL